MKPYENAGIGYKVFSVFNTIFMLLIIFVTVYPFLNILAVSLSSVEALYSGEVTFFPRDFNLIPYKIVTAHPNFWDGYRNTVVYTATGTAIAITLTTLCAYALSKQSLKGRKVFTAIIVFTMVFRPGIIPDYLLIVNLGLTDTMWGVILPAVVVTFNMMVMRTFFTNFPSGLEESAMIDGLNPFGVLFRIVLPLSKGIIATIILFYAVMFWNDWFRGLLYLRTNSKKPITLFLRGIIAGGGLDTSSMQFASKADEAGAVAENIKAAAIILVALPIVMVYPYIQKYFVKGIMLGSLKG